VEIVKMFAKYGANVNFCHPETKETILHKAVQLYDVDMLFALLELGVDLTILNAEGYNPLHLAASYGNAVLVEIMCPFIENINAPSQPNEFPALSIAAYSGHYDVIKILLQHRANIDYRDKQGDTPLHNAIRREDTPKALELIKLGADVTMKTLLDDRDAFELAKTKRILHSLI
jgi:ankyrin repeat protein